MTDRELLYLTVGLLVLVAGGTAYAVWKLWPLIQSGKELAKTAGDLSTKIEENSDLIAGGSSIAKMFGM
jgi:hypothetical protein